MKELRVPKLSLGEGDQMILLEWLVEPGASFTEGDILLEVETDKATMEVDAPFDGVLAKALSEAGQSVAPGQLIAWIADPGEDYDPNMLGAEVGGASGPDGRPDDASASAQVQAQSAAAPRVQEGGDGAVQQAPRRQRSERLVEHGELRGLPEHTTRPQAATTAPAAPIEPLALAPELAGPHETRPFTRHRGAIARSMSASAAIPQFAVDRELEVAPVVEALAALRNEVATATISDVMLLCVAQALGEVPAVNAWCDGSQAYRFQDANIALAVDGPEGVIAPVIRGAQDLALQDLVAQRSRVVEQARQGRVSSADLVGATFSVSNIGPLGAHGLLPMLTPPQVGILALGARRSARGDQTLIRATFAGDHRAIDGADGARFLAALADAIAALPDRA